MSPCTLGACKSRPLVTRIIQWLFPCPALSGFNLVGVVREFAQNELLEHSVSYPCGGADSEVLEQQPHAAIRLGIVGVRNGRRGQNATHARVVRLPVPVVSLTDEGIGERMQSARLIRTRALVEVAWILVQKR